MTLAKSEADAPEAAGLARADLLTRIATHIAAGDPMDEIFKSIIAGVESLQPGVLCSILLLKDGRRLTLGAAPSLPAFYCQAIDGAEIGLYAGSCGRAAYLKRRVVVADIASDPLWVDYKDLAAQAGLAACWSEPIVGAGGRVLGAFAMYQRQPGAPDAHDIATIASAAHLAAIVIERDLTQDALAESEARAREAAEREWASARDLDSFFNASQDILCISNKAGDFVRVNHAWKTMLGYDPETLVGVNYLTLVHPEDRGLAMAATDKLATAGHEVSLTNRYRCADGTFKPIEWRGFVSGERLFGIGRDVTERMAFEAQLDAARQAAEDANRAKSDFLANMSHEVRTPLNGVIGIVDALARTPLSPAQGEMVDLIQSSGATLERLVSDILDVSKIEAGRLDLEVHSFDLTAMIGAVLDVARIRAEERGVGFDATFGPTARGLFRGDSVRLRQVLDNLLSNALKFTHAGKIAVAVDVSDAVDGAQVSELALMVSDTGVGFDPALAADLFDRFRQADGAITRRFGGTGLGLSISKALVEMMGGRIEAASTPGAGSVFTVRVPLPRAAPQAEPAPSKTEPGAEPDLDMAAPAADGAPPLRILLAEDNLTNQKVVSLILAPLGADLTIVENGAQAIEAFREGEFDLVLMDMQMPVMDGLAATRVLREIEQAAPLRRRTAIAMLSANAMAHHREEAAACGADLHIAKRSPPRV